MRLRGFFRTRRQRAAGEPTASRCWFSRRLGFQQLEERHLLATFVDVAPSLNLVFGTNQDVSVISTGAAYSLTLSTGTWSGTNDSDVSGNGLSTLTVTSAGLGAFTTAINITDTGS